MEATTKEQREAMDRLALSIGCRCRTMSFDNMLEAWVPEYERSSVPLRQALIAEMWMCLTAKGQSLLMAALAERGL